jgi:hypothetical protein
MVKEQALIKRTSAVLVDADSNPVSPPYIRVRKLSEPFFAPKSCTCGLLAGDLKDATTSLFQTVEFSCRFLSLFSVFLRTRPQEISRFHERLRDVV